VHSILPTGKGSGAKYHLVQLTLNNLPLSKKHLSENIFMFGIAPLVLPSTAFTDARIRTLPTKSQRQAFMKAERNSLNRGMYRLILAQFALWRSGFHVRDVLSPSAHLPVLLVPALTCFQLDHPEHMGLSECVQCGFCDLGGGGAAALANFDAEVTERTTHNTQALFKPYEAALRSAEAAPAGSRKQASERVRELARPIKEAGLHLPPTKSLLLDEPLLDYSNVAISYLHVLKKVYNSMLSWHLEAIYLACDSHRHWEELLLRANRFVVEEVGTFAALRGRCKRNGLSGILAYSKTSGAPPRVRSKSKSDLANALRFWRVLFWLVNEQAFECIARRRLSDIWSDDSDDVAIEKRGGERGRDRREESEDEGDSEDEDEGKGGDEVAEHEEGTNREGEDGEGEDGEGEDEDNDWRLDGPWMHASVRRFFDQKRTARCQSVDGAVIKYAPANADSQDEQMWKVQHDDGDVEDLDEDELLVALCAHAEDRAEEPKLEEAYRWAGEQEDDEDGGDDEDEGEEGEDGAHKEEAGHSAQDGDDEADSSLIQLSLDRLFSFILRFTRDGASGAELSALTTDGKKMMHTLKAAFGSKRLGTSKVLCIAGVRWRRPRGGCSHRTPPPHNSAQRDVLRACVHTRSYAAVAQAPPRGTAVEVAGRPDRAQRGAR
jgi:hypothetical protein